MKKHHLQIISLFMVELIILLPISFSLTITNLKSTADDTTATISWTTDTSSDSTVRYGKTSSLGLQKSEMVFTKEHSIRLTSLDPNSTYFFEVRSSDIIGMSIENNAGNYYSFKTMTKDVTKPFIDLTLPEYYNQDRIDIAGSTEPYTEVTLYVNGGSTDLRKITTGNDGVFNFYNVKLNVGINSVRIRAVDRAMNTNQTDYRMTVDVTKPTITVKDIPSVVNQKNVTIAGNVDELVTMNVYLQYGAIDVTPPEKITHLTNVSMGSNLVELNWDKSNADDFDYYIVYREDVGPIATAKPASYTGFTDARVNSGQTYTYRVSARDKSGNEGPKSEPLTVTVLPGGRTNMPMWEKIDIPTMADKKLTQSFNVTGTFNIKLDLNKGDGNYQLYIDAFDKAMNTASYYKTIRLDTTPPKITIEKPVDGTNIYESYADEVDIEGTTDPNSEVFLYVQRIPLGKLNSSFSIDSLIEGLDNYPDTRLRGDCALNIAGRSHCGTEADYTTKSDSDGNFGFSNVDLTDLIGLGAGTQIIPTEDLQSFSSVTDQTAELVFISSDGFMRAAKHVAYPIRNCWSGNFSWDITPMTEYQSPTFLSAERLAEGTETLYFYFNISYHAQGTEPLIQSVSITDACDKYIINDPKYNTSCKIIPHSCTTKSNKDNQGNTIWYFACRLQRYEGMDKWMQQDWESFLHSISNEMIFPFRLRINYMYKNDQTTQYDYQTSCEAVTYVVDASKVNFKEVLPDWLLYDAVDWLDKATADLTKARDKIRDILEYTAIGCIVTFGLKFFVTVYRKYTCWSEGLASKLKQSTGVNNQMTCPAGEAEQNKLKNSDLQIKCPACAGAWNAEEKLYQAYRWLCDRVFCHAAPSPETKDKSNKEIEQAYVKQQSANSCGDTGDASAIGQPLEPYRCSQADKGEIDTKLVSDNYAGDECYRAVNYKSSSNSQYIDIWVKLKDSDQNYKDKNIYLFKSVSKTGGRVPNQDMWAVKEGSRYITAQPKTCSEICKDDGYNGGTCKTVDTCSKENTVATSQNNKGTETKTAGYTKDCFFSGWNTDAVSSDPKQRQECCCSKTGEGLGYTASRYYDDKDVRTGEMEADGTGIYPAFSYRYYNIDYETKAKHTTYNPYRYVEGRDLPACFGMPSALDSISKEPTLMLDPFKDQVSTFQCLCISGIYNRIQELVNIMTMMRGCLVSIRTTGTADAGVCKELFSQYICSLIWRLITLFRGGCIPGFGGGIKVQEGEPLSYLSGGLNSVWESVSESQQELAKEYGNANLNNLLGQSEESVARKVCMMAFGYDWEIGLTDVLDAAYSTPYGTLVQAVTRSREYLTFDPFEGKSTYEYRASWLINPGCDLSDYNVYLTCVTRDEISDPNNPGIDCSDVNDPEGSNCDCQYLTSANKPNDYLLYDGKALSQGLLEDKDAHQVVLSQYRYDHLKFVLKPASGIKGDMIARCFPEGHADGVFYFPIRDRTARDIEACYVDTHSGTFRCLSGQAFWGVKGSAYFVSTFINNNPIDNLPDNTIELPEGSDLRIKTNVWRSEGPDQCLWLTVKNSDGTEATGYSNGLFKAVAYPGEVEYDFGQVIDHLSAGSNLRLSISPTSINWEPFGTQSYTSSIKFDIKFKDSGTDGILINSQSTDYIQWPNQQEQPISSVYDKANQKLIIKYGGANIWIKDQPITGNIQERNFTVQTLATGSETKTVKLKLVHLKDSNQSYSDESECNPNDVVIYNTIHQENTYTVKVTPATTAAQEADPVVDLLEIQVSQNHPSIIRVHVKAHDTERIADIDWKITKTSEKTWPLSPQTTITWGPSIDTYSNAVDLTPLESGEYSIPVSVKDNDNHWSPVTVKIINYEANNWYDSQHNQLPLVSFS
jgi:hypothetical protein